MQYASLHVSGKAEWQDSASKRFGSADGRAL
jgi:hypothetical protein